MEDIFQTIDHVTRSKEWNRAFFKPDFEPVQPGLQANEVNLGKTSRYNQTHDGSYNGHSHQVWFINNFRDNNRQQRGPLKKCQGQPHYKNGPKKLTCYYCEGKHKIKDCIKLAKESLKTNNGAQTSQSITKTNLNMLCRKVALPSTRHHLPGCQKQPTPWNNGATFWKPATK